MSIVVIQKSHRPDKKFNAVVNGTKTIPFGARGMSDFTIHKDEEPFNVKFDKIAGLNPAFSKTGTVTAANASTMNDGAAALILMSGEKMKALGLTPLAKITSYADAAHDPKWFTTAPS